MTAAILNKIFRNDKNHNPASVQSCRKLTLIQRVVPLQAFSLKKTVYDLLYWEDSTSSPAKLLNLSPFNRPADVRVVEVQGAPARYSATKLSNGVTVLTESTTVPSNVQLGILLNVGTRDETPETSGSLLSIKNTYLKTVLNTN